MLRKLIDIFIRKRAARSSDGYIKYLRSKGVRIGSRCVFHQRSGVLIDLTRPSLIELGDDVHITDGVKILTHGYDWVVLLNKYGEMINSSGRVVIGNNVFIGMSSIILKGVSIGDNVVVGAGSVVTRSIPSDTVVAGNPAKVICSIEEYYSRRLSRRLGEAKEYARSIECAFGRRPVASDFWEEFPLFSEDGYGYPVGEQYGDMTDCFYNNNKSKYVDLNSFLKDCEIVGGSV